LELAAAIMVGLLVGHLADVFFDRLFTGSALLAPICRCATCGAQFPRTYCVPLLGYALSRGHCAACKSGLPARTVVLPIGSAALFATAYLALGELGAGLLGGTFAAVFLVLTLTDIDRGLLPNRLVYPALLLAMAFSWGWPDNSVASIYAGGLLAAAIAAVFYILSLPFGEGAFGMGDVKLIILTGFAVGLPSVPVALLIGTLLAGVFAAVLVITGRRRTSDYIPHGPFLAFGAVTALFWGNDIWDAFLTG
jgi:leader peptidase (prepilin peptidase)/N-methyltransferase